jgi:hypothetical protein
MILSRWLRTLFLGRQRTTAPSTAFYGLSKSIEAGAWTDPRRNQGHYEFRTLFRRTSMWGNGKACGMLGILQDPITLCGQGFQPLPLP